MPPARERTYTLLPPESVDSLRWHLRVLGAEAELADFDTDDFLGREADLRLAYRPSNPDLGLSLRNADMDADAPPAVLAHVVDRRARR